MIYFMSAISLLLLLAFIRLYAQKKETDRVLQYMTTKLEHLASHQSKERLLVFTGEKNLQELLASINELLDHHHEYLADSSRVRLSMNRMLSNISHDLKTPLTVILGYIETIQHDQSLTSEERNILLSKVYKKVLDLTGLIHQFFDLAKLESGDWPLELRSLHINEVCRQFIVGYYDTFTSKGLDVSIDIQPDPLFIRADEVAITRVLSNLLSNAILHGKEGQVIGLAVRHSDENVMIEIWDKGKGIAEKDRYRIFERLFTMDDSRSSTIEGSGLGLTIAKGLTEQMNGQISVSSVPFLRTAFTITFKKVYPDAKGYKNI